LVHAKLNAAASIKVLLLSVGLAEVAGRTAVKVALTALSWGAPLTAT